MGDHKIAKVTSPDEIRSLINVASMHELRIHVANYTSEVRNFLQERLYEHGFEKAGWLLREVFRNNKGVYESACIRPADENDERLNAYLNEHEDHFVHLSKDEPGQIAYTPDANYGRADRKVKTSIGRYIKKYNPDISDATLRSCVEAFRYNHSADGVRWAATADEIINVYTTGPHSCMAHKWNDKSDTYGSHIHPAAVYESPDLKVAYLVRNNKINARALVYETPELKSYIRIYGDTILERKLKSLGYKQGNLQGAKIKKLQALRTDGQPMHDTYVCPYLDDVLRTGASFVDVSGEWGVVTNNPTNYTAHTTTGLIGKYSAYKRSLGTTVGVSTPEQAECALCGTTHDSADLVTVLNSSPVCSYCANNNYVFGHYKNPGVEGGHRCWMLRSDTINVTGLYYLNDDETRNFYDLVALDPSLYGVEYSRSEFICFDHQGRLIKSCDAYIKNGVTYYESELYPTTYLGFHILRDEILPPENYSWDAGYCCLGLQGRGIPILERLHQCPSESEVRAILCNEPQEIQRLYVSIYNNLILEQDAA